MRRVQYVSQKSVKDFDVADLNDREQDEFIKEVAESMARDMRSRTKDALPLGDAGFQVTGPHHDPIQGSIHVHTIAAWFDLDRMAADSEFRQEYESALTRGGTGETTINHDTIQEN